MTTTYEVLAGPDAVEAADALAGLLDRMIAGAPLTAYAEADPAPWWAELTAGGWDRLGAEGLSLRDLVEVATAAGRRALPVPLVPSLATGVPAVAVARRARPGTVRIPYGAPPFAGAARDAEPDPFAPTLRLVTAEATATPLDDAARHRLAVLWAAEAVGAGRALVDGAVAYAKTREQFGTPIGRFQAVKHLLADATLALAEATTAVLLAANEPVYAAGAVRLAGDRALTASETATQVYGGIGMTWELGAHLLTRHILTLRDLTEDLEAPHGTG